MHLVTTTRFHLVAAFVAACTLTRHGFAIAALLIGLELLRVLARHHLGQSTLGPAAPVAAYGTRNATESAAGTRPSLAA
jgi:hypothetical protein